MQPVTAVKCYHRLNGMTERVAAKWFAQNDVDWVLARSELYDAALLRHELRDAGVKFFDTTVMFHDPEAFAADPGLRPVAASGRILEPEHWYAGICPSNEDYLRRKVEKIAASADLLSPDGLFLSFIRFPAFWEIWESGTIIDECCFCTRCLTRFQHETGIDFGGDTTALRTELRAEWTAWKCGLIASVAQAVRTAVPGIPVVLNEFGLGGGDFGNAVEHVLGQRFTDLDEVADYHELMFYFQIQRRDPVSWIPRRLAEARLKSNKPLLACLQAAPEYLEPKYGSGRATEITDEQWRSALRAARQADGVVVYSWRGLLAEPSRAEALRDYRNGLL